MYIRKTSILTLILSLFFSISLFPEHSPLLRISIENTEDHVQTEYIMRFAELLNERAGDALSVELYHSGMMYQDREVIDALYTGKIEMAVPGTWHVSGHIPEISYFLLPEFFGETKNYNYEYISSPEGRELIRKMEEELNIIIPGDWMDLGHAVVFTTRRNKIKRFRDFSGKTIRVAGGLMNKRRIELLGADGVIISWTDVPYHLRKGTIDGLLTTFETVKSAELWEYGIKYAFLDNEYFPQYIPMISRHFWEMISPELQELITSTWNEVAGDQRMAAERSQSEARQMAEANGIRIITPSDEDLQRAKAMLMNHQQDLINEIIH